MELLSFIFPASLFTFIVAVFLSRNPVYGVLAFVAVVMHVVILLVLLDLEFLAYVLAIVYIGAIVVLFLFVIMMFYIHHFTTKRSIIRGTVEYYLLGWLSSNAVYYLAFFDHTSYSDYALLVYSSNLVSMVAWYLFNDGTFLTILAALIMLIGIIGAIVLTVKTTTITSRNTIKIRNSVIDILEKKK